MALPRSAPRDERVDATGLLAFLDTAETSDLDLHSLMVLRHGRVVAEGWWAPYAPDRPHLGYSLSKSFTATAIGLLVGDGALRLDEPVVERLPASSWAAGWERVTVRHCLDMTVGHDEEAWDRVRPVGGDLLPGALAVPIDHEPGTHFAYNQVATYLLSRIVWHATGRGVADLLAERVLGPLDVPVPPWHSDRQGHELGFSGVHPTTETVAALGQLYLDGGRHDGRAVLDPDWVPAALPRVDGPPNRDPGAPPDWRRGYGFSLWGQRHGFRGDGAFGQFMVVVPELDVVVAITSEVLDMQATLDALWAHVVPAVDHPASAAADAELASRLADAALPAVRGELRHERVEAGRVRGGSAEELHEAWDAVTVAGDRLVLRRDTEDVVLPVGVGRWAEGTLSAAGGTLPVAVSGGWSDDVFSAEVVLVQTPHRFRVELTPREASLRWRRLPLSGPEPVALAVW